MLFRGIVVPQDFVTASVVALAILNLELSLINVRFGKATKISRHVGYTMSQKTSCIPNLIKCDVDTDETIWRH